MKMKMLITVLKYAFSSVLPVRCVSTYFFRATVPTQQAFPGVGIAAVHHNGYATVYAPLRIQLRLMGCRDLACFVGRYVAQKGGAIISDSHGVIDVLCTLETASVLMNASKAYRGGRCAALSRPIITLFEKYGSRSDLFCNPVFDNNGDIRNVDFSTLAATPATVEVIQFNEGGVNYEAASSTSEILQVEVADADASYPPASSVFASPYDVPAPHKLAFARAKAFAVANGKMAAKDGVVDLQGVPVDIGWEDADFDLELDIEVVSKYPN